MDQQNLRLSPRSRQQNQDKKTGRKTQNKIGGRHQWIIRPGDTKEGKRTTLRTTTAGWQRLKNKERKKKEAKNIKICSNIYGSICKAVTQSVLSWPIPYRFRFIFLSRVAEPDVSRLLTLWRRNFGGLPSPPSSLKASSWRRWSTIFPSMTSDTQRRITWKKTGDMDLQKEKQGLTTEFWTDALLNIMPERYNRILDALETRDHKCGIGRFLFSASGSARRWTRLESMGYDFHQQRGLKKPHCHKSSHKIQQSIQQHWCVLLSPWPRRSLTKMAPRRSARTWLRTPITPIGDGTKLSWKRDREPCAADAQGRRLRR